MPSSRSAVLPALLVLVACTGCNPYERFAKDDDGLGPVDPVNFPPANLGTGGNRKQPGIGAFTAIGGYAGGMPVEYFNYPFPTPLADDPLRLEEDGMPVNPAATPTVYSFGAGYQCTPPPGYTPDPRLDEVPRNVQGNIFTAVPTASYTPERGPRSTYIPVLSEAVVTGPSLECQKPKSKDALTAALGMLPPRDGKYLAWLVIDPAAAVYPVGKSADDDSGVSLQGWGWYNRYLLAYLDGGEIPTEEMTVMEGDPVMTIKVREMVPQKIYYPRSMVMNAMGMAAAGRLGAGYDVLSAKRGTPGYSPVCAVYTYDAGMPLARADLPKDEATIMAMFNSMAAPIRPAATPYIFCLQVVKP
jgi:hypothetical protein